MLVQTYFPDRLAPSRYDTFLASGWFRGSVMLYKMDLLCIDNDVFSVVNIRLNLLDFELRKSQRKILRRAMKKFRITEGRARPNPSKELLYHHHKKKFRGFIHPTLEDYLNSGYRDTVFDTREICVYDGDHLVAVSFYDRGEQAIASLLGLYDDNYKSFSPGILTMLLEIQTAIREGFRWYYPGYVLDQPSQFNYKLRLGNFQYYNPNKRWASYEQFKATESKAYRFKERIAQLKALLIAKGLAFEEVLYPLFSMGYVQYWNANFLKYPLVLAIEGAASDEMLILSYDLDKGLFAAEKVVPAPHYEHLVNMEASGDFRQGSRYAMQLLMVTEHVASSTTPEMLMTQI